MVQMMEKSIIFGILRLEYQNLRPGTFLCPLKAVGIWGRVRFPRLEVARKPSTIVPQGPKLIAILSFWYITAKTIFDRFDSIPRWQSSAKFVKYAFFAYTPTAHSQLFLDSCVFWPCEWNLFGTCGNMAKLTPRVTSWKINGSQLRMEAFNRPPFQARQKISNSFDPVWGTRRNPVPSCSIVFPRTVEE